jgi:hypothetical protein
MAHVCVSCRDGFLIAIEKLILKQNGKDGDRKEFLKREALRGWEIGNNAPVLNG